VTAPDAIRWARRVRSERPPTALDEAALRQLARSLATRIFVALEKPV